MNLYIGMGAWLDNIPAPILGVALVILLTSVLILVWRDAHPELVKAKKIKRFIKKECGLDWEDWYGRPVYVRIWWLDSGVRLVWRDLESFKKLQDDLGNMSGNPVVPKHWIAAVDVYEGKQPRVFCLNTGGWWKLSPELPFLPAEGKAIIEDKLHHLLNFQAEPSDEPNALLQMVLEVVLCYDSVTGYMLNYAGWLIAETIDKSRHISGAPVLKRVRLFADMLYHHPQRAFPCHRPGLPELPDRDESAI